MHVHSDLSREADTSRPPSCTCSGVRCGPHHLGPSDPHPCTKDGGGGGHLDSGSSWLFSSWCPSVGRGRQQSWDPGLLGRAPTPQAPQLLFPPAGKLLAPPLFLRNNLLLLEGGDRALSFVLSRLWVLGPAELLASWKEGCSEPWPVPRPALCVSL